MNDDSYDPRSVANLLLDEADRLGIPVTNLALQKLLYFAHGLHLNENKKKPLVGGYFEAWTYGPVHPTVYRAFKSAGGEPITVRAERTDALTGEKSPIAPPNSPTVLRLVRQVLNAFGRLSPGRLVDISHAKGAPWQYIVDKAGTGVAFGLRISDDVILDRFQFHKICVGDAAISGEPSEDTPLT